MTGAADAISDATGTPESTETPRLPVSMLPSQLVNCCHTGRSSP